MYFVYNHAVQFRKRPINKAIAYRNIQMIQVSVFTQLFRNHNHFTIAHQIQEIFKHVDCLYTFRDFGRFDRFNIHLVHSEGVQHIAPRLGPGFGNRHSRLHQITQAVAFHARQLVYFDFFCLAQINNGRQARQFSQLRFSVPAELIRAHFQQDIRAIQGNAIEAEISSRIKNIP